MARPVLGVLFLLLPVMDQITTLSCRADRIKNFLTAPLMMVLVRVTCLEGLWQNVTHEM